MEVGDAVVLEAARNAEEIDPNAVAIVEETGEIVSIVMAVSLVPKATMDPMDVVRIDNLLHFSLSALLLI